MTANEATSTTVNLSDAVRELGDRVALVKAQIVGGDRIADSNAMPWTDIDQREQAFAGMGVVTPPYDPETLAVLFENSSSLRQNVDAYVTNIDAFGHRFEPVIDLDANDADERIGNAMFIERERAANESRFHDDPAAAAGVAQPTPEEVAARRAEVAVHMRLERSRLETFFSCCCVDVSFVTLRRRTRQDLEVMGNGYWEVLRNGAGDLVQFVYIPGFTMRLLPVDLALVEVDIKAKISELSYEALKVRRRFRRYVQIFEGQVVFFKEFGDPRILSRKLGLFYASVEELLAQDPTDGPATEILHFRLHNPRSAYGTPRWIGTLLAVLGSRQAEEVNYLYFENKSVPPLALLVSGGRLSAQSVPRIESFIETHLKGKKNFHKILVLEAESGGSNLDHTGRMKIELRPLTNAQQNDALFQQYDERNSDKVGQSFRLPRLLRGDIRDFNRSCYSADTETLTENGWKLHHQIGPGERIAVYDPAVDELRFEVPASKHVAFVREDLLRFVDLHTDVLVTADHKMLRRCSEGDWHAEPAAKLARRSRFELRCAPGRDAVGRELIEFTLPTRCLVRRDHAHEALRGDVWLELLGAFLADDGLLDTDHPYRVFIRQRQPVFRARLRACLERTGWAFSTQIHHDGTHVFCVANRCLRDWLATNCGTRGAGRRLPWRYVTGLTVRQLALLFRSLCDGTRAAGAQAGSFVSTSPTLAAQVQAMCVRLGRTATCVWDAYRGMFRVDHSSQHTTELSKQRNVRWVRYDGEVYCFACPGAGFFVTRRNGKVAIQGNTADAALTLAEMQVFQPEREEFDYLINHKLLAELGIRFWKFRSNAPVTRDPAAMSDIIRGLVNANILTPEEGRSLASDVFNRDFKSIAAGWVKQPVSLTLAGIPPTPEPASDVPTPEVQKGDPVSRRRRRDAPPPDLAGEAARLIALRDALLDAEARRATQEFHDDKRAELEREVLKVPADELASWFEPKK